MFACEPTINASQTQECVHGNRQPVPPRSASLRHPPRVGNGRIAAFVPTAMSALAGAGAVFIKRPLVAGFLTLLLLVLVGLGIGETMGWPMLSGPLQRLMADKLDRRVSLTAPSATASDTAPTFRLRFLGGVELRASQMEIGAPSWSTSPHLLLARDVSLDLRYIDLWRAYRGQPLRVERLQASTLDGNLERLADGRASWQFRPPPTNAPIQPLLLPQFGSLQVADGTLRYRDKPFDLDVDAQLTLADSSVMARVSAAPAAPAAPVASAASAATTSSVVTQQAPANGLRVTASGRYRQFPLKLTLSSSGVLPWAADPALAAPVPVTVNATIGRASLLFNGSAVDALSLGGLSGRFSLKGPSLAAVGDPVGVTLPTTGAFRTDGMIVKEGNTWRIRVDDATVGASRLNGAFTYEAGLAVPTLSGRLGGTRLLLADLGPVLGTTPALASAAAAEKGDAVGKPLDNTAKTKGKVLPDRPFDLAALRMMNANVLIDIRDVDLNTSLLEPLRPLHAHLQLEGGVLTITDIDARTADGRLMGMLRLDGRATNALWNTDLRWDGVRLERWLKLARAEGAPPYVSGKLNGRALLRGQGRSTAEILASLKGTVRSQLRDGSVSHLVIEAAGIDIAQGLGVLFKGDDSLKVQCAVADLAADGGVLRPRVMVIDTTDSTLLVDGSLSLATEVLDLRAVVSPKDFSPLSLRTPLLVRGSFAHPQVSLDKGPLGRKLATAALLALVSPLAGLIPLIDPGDSAAADRDATACPGLAVRTAAKTVPVPARRR